MIISLMSSLLLNINNGTIVTGNRTADQDIILFREDLHDFQALHLHPVAAHPAGHPHTLHYAVTHRKSYPVNPEHADGHADHATCSPTPWKP